MAAVQTQLRSALGWRSLDGATVLSVVVDEGVLPDGMLFEGMLLEGMLLEGMLLEGMLFDGMPVLAVGAVFAAGWLESLLVVCA